MKIACPIAALLLVFFRLPVHSQIPNWEWAKDAIGNSTAVAVCNDANGNAYVTGHFLGPLVFDNDTINDSLGAYQDIFIAKYDSTGNALWARNGKGYADVFGIGTDANGNVYLTGDFYNDSLTFGGNVLLNPNAGAQSSNIFLVKYNAQGDVLWAENPGGINNNQVNGLSTDTHGNVYISGTFIGDSLAFGNISVQHIGNNDGFIAKFNPSGNAMWIRNVGSPYADGTAGICTDAGGNAFMAGYFLSSNLFLGNINNYISSPYYNNIYLIKYDSLGNMRWAKYTGGNNFNSTIGIAADALGDVYITGYYDDTMFFNNNTLASIGYENFFTAKYDTSGEVVWAKSAGGTNADQSTGITADANGNTYLTGVLQSDTFTFGSSGIFNPFYNLLTFVAKYDPNGNAEWAVAPGGTSSNIGAGISCSNGTVYVDGTFQGSGIIFGADTLPLQPLFPAPYNFFLAKLFDTNLNTGVAPINNLADKIFVYPNPSTGIFYFNGLASGNTIDIYNTLGQSIYTAIADNDNYPLSLFGNAQGIYLYRIKDENGISLGTGKIIVQ